MSAKQLILSSVSVLEEFSNSYLKPLGIDGFSYSYSVPGGTRSLLISNAKSFELMEFDKRRVHSDEKWPNTIKIKRLPWHTTPMFFERVPEKAAHFMAQKKQLIKENTGLSHLISLSHYIDNDLEAFEFFSKDETMNDSIFSEIDNLQRFRLLFKDKANDLITEVKRKPIMMAQNSHLYESENSLAKQPLISHAGRYYLNDPQGRYLTEREARSLSLLFQCRSTKEIGEILGNSSRTIESHIRSVKDKFYCRKQSELYDVLTQLGFDASLIH